MLRDDLLPAFEGIAQFFSHYMIPCNEKGHCEIKHRNRHKPTTFQLAHESVTGPTGSPENSYSFSTTGGKSGHSAVAFTPAIDSSVLRQVDFVMFAFLVVYTNDITYLYHVLFTLHSLRVHMSLLVLYY